MANQSHKKESAAPHLWAFALSIVLTLLAFYAVANEEVSRSFVLPFIFFLAVVQAAFQLIIWMHLNQKNYEFARMGMFAGVFCAAVIITGTVLWLWI